MHLTSPHFGLSQATVEGVTGNPNSMGDAMITDPDADLITFTGSVGVGKMLAAKAAGLMKRSTMELGGHAPVIICDDADIDTFTYDNHRS